MKKTNEPERSEKEKEWTNEGKGNSLNRQQKKNEED